METLNLLIGGQDIIGREIMDVINPATGLPFIQCSVGDTELVDRAVVLAKSAQKAWSSKSWTERQACLARIADDIHSQSEDLSRMLTLEQGKPLAEARLEVAYTEGFFRYYSSAELPRRVLEQTGVKRIEAHARPLGVVAAITPWNFPLLIAAVKVPAALLAGNAVILKPAPTTPVSTLMLGRIIDRHVPKGTIAVLVDRNDLGEVLTTHPDIRKVSFTGSTATGKRVMSSAAGTLKRITLELGGNDAAIVLGDVNPADVARRMFPSIFTCAGQNCLAVKRIYAQRDVYEQLGSELASIAKQAVVGDGLAAATTMGPLQNVAQYDRVKALYAEASQQGCVLSGGPAEGTSGYFFRPTVIADMENGMRLVDEEQFGPLIPLIPFDHSEEALRLANASIYGLGGSVWSKDVDAAYQLAAQLEVGTAWVNQHFDVSPQIPFSGAKQSGIGFEFALEGLAEFTQQQIINVAVQGNK